MKISKKMGEARLHINSSKTVYHCHSLLSSWEERKMVQKKHAFPLSQKNSLDFSTAIITMSHGADSFLPPGVCPPLLNPAYAMKHFSPLASFFLLRRNRIKLLHSFPFNFTKTYQMYDYGWGGQNRQTN